MTLSCTAKKYRPLSDFFFKIEHVFKSCIHTRLSPRVFLFFLRPCFSVLLETERLAEMHQNKRPMSLILLPWCFTSNARCGTRTVRQGLGWFFTVSVHRSVFSASAGLFAGCLTTRTRGRPGNESRGHLRLAEPPTPPPASTLGKGAARADLTRKSLLSTARPHVKSENMQ